MAFTADKLHRTSASSARISQQSAPERQYIDFERSANMGTPSIHKPIAATQENAFRFLQMFFSCRFYLFCAQERIHITLIKDRVDKLVWQKKIQCRPGLQRSGVKDTHVYAIVKKSTNQIPLRIVFEKLQRFSLQYFHTHQ